MPKTCMNDAIQERYFDALYPNKSVENESHIDFDMDRAPITEEGPSKDGLWNNFNPCEVIAKQSFDNYRASPDKVLANAHQGTLDLWASDKEWACGLLHKAVPEELSYSLYGQYVKKWESYILSKKSNSPSKSRSNQANIWLRKRIELVKRAVVVFPVPLKQLRHEGLRKSTAKMWADKCLMSVHESAEEKKSMAEAYEVIADIIKGWDFSVKTPTQKIIRLSDESKEDYKTRKQDEVAGFKLLRLLDDAWWLRKINTAYRRFSEHCQILTGRARQGVSIYLSDAGLRDFRARKAATKIALSKMVARNEETGEEVNLLELYNGSVSNPTIRRHELMVRMAGFNHTAEEYKLISGFFTLTAPSKYHAYNSIKDENRSYENPKYEGFTPAQTQKYLATVWARARAKLKRMKIPLMGFRVCEPHHDETPHWHGLFFFKPQHEAIIRYVFAHYFTKEDREELDVSDEEFAIWSKAFDKHGEKIANPLIKGKEVSEQEMTDLIKSISHRISARVDYKRMDPAKGGAIAYIAKYIAKNVDGYHMEDDEESNTSGSRNAEAACGWASTWGIRQFQQIGGPPVTVWRELRLLPQDAQVKSDKAAAKEKGEKYQPKIRAVTDLENEEHTIEVARIAADSNNWSMFIHVMGGLFATRANFPITMVYKPVDNAYGEQIKKLKGIGTFDKTMITHSDTWIITKPSVEGAFDLKKNGSFSPWSSVNNCTENENSIVEQAVIDQFNQLGVDLDDHILGPAMNGAKILTGDGRKASIIYTDLGLQMRIEEITASDIGWKEW